MNDDFTLDDLIYGDNSDEQAFAPMPKPTRYHVVKPFVSTYGEGSSYGLPYLYGNAPKQEGSSIADALRAAANEPFGAGVSKAEKDYNYGYGGAMDASKSQVKKDGSWFMDALHGLAATPSQLLDMFEDSGKYVLGGIGEAIGGKTGREYGESAFNVAATINPITSIAHAYGKYLNPLYKKSIEENNVDKDSTAFFLGDLTGNILATVATMGGAAAAEGAAITFNIGSKIALKTTAQQMAKGAVVNSLLQMGSTYDKMKSGQMSKGEWYTRGALAGGTGSILSGQVGRVANLGEKTAAKFIPYTWGKQIAADAATNAGQSLATTAAVDILPDSMGGRDVSAREYITDAAMGAGVGTGFGLAAKGLGELPQGWDAVKKIASSVRRYAGGADTPEGVASQVAAQANAAKGVMGDFTDALKVSSYMKDSDLPTSVKKVMSTGTESDLANLQKIYASVVGKSPEGVDSQTMVSEISALYHDPMSLPKNMENLQGEFSGGVINADEVVRDGTAKDDPVKKALADIEINSYLEKFSATMLNNGGVIPQENQDVLRHAAELLKMQYPEGGDFSTKDYLAAMKKAIDKNGLSFVDATFGSVRNQLYNPGAPDAPISFLFENKYEFARKQRTSLADNGLPAGRPPKGELPEGSAASKWNAEKEQQASAYIEQNAGEPQESAPTEELPPVEETQEPSASPMEEAMKDMDGWEQARDFRKNAEAQGLSTTELVIAKQEAKELGIPEDEWIDAKYVVQRVGKSPEDYLLARDEARLIGEDPIKFFIDKTADEWNSIHGRGTPEQMFGGPAEQPKPIKGEPYENARQAEGQEGRQEGLLSPEPEQVQEPAPTTDSMEPSQGAVELPAPMGSKSYSTLTDADIENLMTDIESKGVNASETERAEFSRMEKEMVRRERLSVLSKPLEQVSHAIDVLMKKNKDMPNGWGADIDASDAIEAKRVAEKYLRPEEISNEELIQDFINAILHGNPSTSYADGLKIREAMSLADTRGIRDALMDRLEKKFIGDGYSARDAREIAKRKLEPLLREFAHVPFKGGSPAELPAPMDESQYDWNDSETNTYEPIESEMPAPKQKSFGQLRDENIGEYGEPREDNPLYMFHKKVMELSDASKRTENYQDLYSKGAFKKLFRINPDNSVTAIDFTIGPNDTNSKISKALKESGVKISKLREKLRNGLEDGIDILDGAYTAYSAPDNGIMFIVNENKGAQAPAKYAVYERMTRGADSEKKSDIELAIEEDSSPIYRGADAEGRDRIGDYEEGMYEKSKDDLYKRMRNVYKTNAEEYGQWKSALDGKAITKQEFKSFLKNVNRQDWDAPHIEAYAKVLEFNKKNPDKFRDAVIGAKKEFSEEAGNNSLDLQMQIGNFAPGAAYIWASTYDDDEMTPLGITGKTLKQWTLLGATVFYGKKGYNAVNNLKRGVNTKFMGTGSPLKRVLDKVMSTGKYPPVGQEIDQHSRNIFKSLNDIDRTGVNQSPESIQAYRHTIDKEANKGFNVNPKAVSVTHAVKTNNIVAEFDKNVQSLNVIIERNIADTAKPLHDYLSSLPDNERKYIKSVVALVQNDIGTIRKSYPDEALGNVIDHYNNQIVPNKYFKDNPDLHAKYLKTQELLSPVRQLHVTGMAIGMTGEMPENFVASLKQSEEAVSMYQELLASARAGYEKYAGADPKSLSPQERASLDAAKESISQLELEMRTAKGMADKLKYISNLRSQTDRELYFSRWHNKSMPFEVRIRQSDGDPGFRVGFNTKDEAEAFAKLHKDAEFVEVGRGSMKEAAKYADEQNMRGFLDAILTSGDPEDVIDAYQLRGIVDALAAYDIVKNELWINDVMGRQVMTKDGRMSGTVYRKDLMNLYISLSSPEGSNPFAWREDVQGFLPTQNTRIKDEGVRMADWLDKMERHFDSGVEYMSNYYRKVHNGVGQNKLINDITGEMNKLQVGGKLVQWFDYYRDRLARVGEKDHPIGDRLSAIAVTRALVYNIKSATTNRAFGMAAIVDEGISRYGFDPDVWLKYPGEYVRSYVSQVDKLGVNPGDVTAVINEMNRLDLLGGGYSRSLSRLERELPFGSGKVAKKFLDIGFAPTKYAEYLNNRDGAVLAAIQHFKTNPGDIDGAIAEALVFNKNAQGRYSVESASQVEYEWRNKGMGWMFTLVTPALRNFSRVFANAENMISGPNKVRHATSLAAHIGGATLIAGIGGIVGVGDVYKAMGYLNGLTQDKDDDTALTAENANEYWRRKTEAMFAQNGFQKGSGESFFDWITKGGFTMATGKNFTNDASVQGMVTNPVVVDMAKTMLEAGKAFMQDPMSKKAFFKYADLTGVEFSRAMRAYWQMAETPNNPNFRDMSGGAYLDSQGNQLRGGYHIDDAIGEIFFGRNEKDYNANQMKYTGGGGIYSPNDAVTFGKRLAAFANDMSISKKDIAAVAGDEWLANEFRSRLLFKLDKYEGMINKGQEGVDNIVSRLPMVLSAATGTTDQYGKNIDIDPIKTSMKKEVTKYFTSLAIQDAYREMGLEPPTYKYERALPGDVIAEKLMKKLKTQEKKALELQ